MRTRADLAALYIINYARLRQEELTFKKLMGLLYYCQAWHLAHEGKPLFDEDFIAWDWGPVVPELHQQFHAFDIEEALPLELFSGPDETTKLNVMTPSVKGYIDEIMMGYFDMSSLSLMEAIKNEKPWCDAWRGAHYELDYQIYGDQPRSTLIYKEWMMSFYGGICSSDERRQILMEKALQMIIEDCRSGLSADYSQRELFLWSILNKASRALEGETITGED